MTPHITTIEAMAAERGYTRRIWVDTGHVDLSGYVRPEADLDGRFGFFDDDTGEHLALNGWMIRIREAG